MRPSPTARVGAAYRTIAEADRPEVRITLRDQADALADAAAVEQGLAAGEHLPLAGLPTTAGCREFAYRPATTAVAIERLRAAGAVVLGKTNLDQFGCGLAGTRSPYGAVRNSRHPDLVSGGSSSGSAVAVALGIADIGIGTDTAGSIRVPAALNGLVAIKPTLGIVPTHGVVPACVSYDAVCVLAADLALATTAVAVMAGPDPRDPRGRPWPADVRLAAPDAPRLAIPEAANLAVLSPGYRDAFEQSARLATDAGCSVKPIDISVLLDAALLLYDGAIVAERYAAVGEFLETAPASADPVVGSIIAAARSVTGPAFAADLDALARARADAAGLLDGFDALLLPTTTEHPSLREVGADPVGISRRMGTYTNFCNLLDMAAVTVPIAPTPAGTPVGVTIVVPAFDDQIAADIGARLTGAASTLLAQTGVDLAVFGAHRRRQPLHGQLERLGARFVAEISTADARPGELFRIFEAGLGGFLAAAPAPMALTAIELDDGRSVTGVTG
ncbi:allophanate hydrolase [Mycobacterium stomatepiae]|uniref:Allophanate hydrolase n=1 Tax=Mycobacterium stomatepiae TaxID=470076 RepID=A0A7I7Q208_9MYCO|nr:allophanate hydrolase [Mycobacterium stomatepiae]MCV7165319.1 allophanate hydrolase [Mycobacterium stomatepiae]BBY20430.1 allophanate hydrolase [Mycobacterium stomatepiae]